MPMRNIEGQEGRRADAGLTKMGCMVRTADPTRGDTEGDDNDPGNATGMRPSTYLMS